MAWTQAKPRRGDLWGIISNEVERRWNAIRELRTFGSHASEARMKKVDFGAAVTTDFGREYRRSLPPWIDNEQLAQGRGTRAESKT